MLKMLQAPALEAWKAPEASEVRELIDFTGVFVPTDRSWSTQLTTLSAGRLTRAAFTTHVLRAVIAAMRHRTGRTARPDVHIFPHRRASLLPEAERDLVNYVADGWHLSPIVPTLASLHLALTQRLLAIREISTRLSPAASPDEQPLPSFVDLAFIEASALAIECFEQCAELPRGRWALLFDELELAPRPILSELLAAPRGVDEHFLFKLSLSPFTPELMNLESQDAPAEQHDYQLIQLSYPRKEDGYLFCRSLLQGMLEDRGLPQTEAERVFGRSVFDTAPDTYRRGRTAYSAGSALVAEYVELARTDRTFLDYLAKHHIDLERLAERTHSERAADVRKLRGLVAVRSAYRAADREVRGRPRLRSRKTPAIYHGADALFAIAEGNPRLFISLIGRILDRVAAQPRYPIPSEFQTQEVDRAANRFLALLRTIPVSRDSQSLLPDPNPRGVLDFVERLGEAFRAEIVLGPFAPQPVGSFTIDSHAAPAVIEMTGLALNAGAVVYVPDSGSSGVLTSFPGKRFRLSYLVSSRFGLPLRIDRDAPLSKLLAKSDDPSSPRREGQPNLLELPGLQ
jgi:hypothetical protein